MMFQDNIYIYRIYHMSTCMDYIYRVYIYIIVYVIRFVLVYVCICMYM